MAVRERWRRRCSLAFQAGLRDSLGAASERAFALCFREDRTRRWLTCRVSFGWKAAASKFSDGEPNGTRLVGNSNEWRAPNGIDKRLRLTNPQSQLALNSVVLDNRDIVEKTKR